jgi:hypothetical protein
MVLTTLKVLTFRVFLCNKIPLPHVIYFQSGTLRLIIFNLLFFFSISSFAQLGGRNGYAFLSFPVNAKTSAIGGMNASSRDNSPTSMMNNPALLNKDMHNRAEVNFAPFFANISYTTAAYAFDHKKFGGTTGFGVQYMYYGIAKVTDEGNNEQGGNVGANDFAITAGHSRTKGNYTLGVNVKLAGSQLANSSSLGLLTDVGGIFKHPVRDLTIGLLVKNLGFPVKSYGAIFTVSMPLDVQIGITFKPQHMPFRFSMLIHHLQRYDIAYDDPNNVTGYDINGTPIIDRVSVLDHIARHFVFGGELLLIKGFNIQLGYNHMMRSDLETINAGGLSGFSLGCMLKVRMFDLSYSHAFYHAVGGLNTFSLNVKLDSFYKKADIPQESTDKPN